VPAPALAWSRFPHSSFTRNEGVPDSSPGVGFSAERFTSDPCALQVLGVARRGRQLAPAPGAENQDTRNEPRTRSSHALLTSVAPSDVYAQTTV
jgi:hypothetical protein